MNINQLSSGFVFYNIEFNTIVKYEYLMWHHRIQSCHILLRNEIPVKLHDNELNRFLRKNMLSYDDATKQLISDLQDIVKYYQSTLPK